MSVDRKSIENAIDQLRPSFNIEGGDIQFIGVDEEGVVEVSLTGACHGCAMSVMHLKMGVEQYLKDMVPGVTEVVTTDGF